VNVVENIDATGPARFPEAGPIDQPPALPRSVSKSEQHRASFEWLRLVSCMGIIWFHCEAPVAVVGYAGLPALIALSVGLASVPGKVVSLPVIIKKRARRLLLPWIFWCLIYSIWRLASTWIMKKPMGEAFQGWMLFVGPSIHLWYLPFAYVATCLAGVINGGRPSSGWANSIFWTLCAVITFLLCSWWMSAYSIPIPLLQWTFGLPAVLIGLALPQMHRREYKRLGMASLALAIALAGIAAWLCGWRELTVPYMLGTLALAAAWVLPMSASPKVVWLGSLSYGVYLVHPLISSFTRWATGTHPGAGLAIIVAILSILLVALLRRGPLEQFM